MGENVKTKIKSPVFITVIILVLLVVTIFVVAKACSTTKYRTFKIEKIIDRNNGFYSIVLEDNITYNVYVDEIKLGEENEICIDTRGVDSIKYVSITNKMAKSLGINIKEEDGVVIIKEE